MSSSYMLKLGHEGQEVKRLQVTLGGLSQDGEFGPKTEAAVKDYQQKNNLSTDGVAGPKLSLIHI